MKKKENNQTGSLEQHIIQTIERLSTTYDSISPLLVCDTFYVEREGKKGIVRSDGHELVPITMDNIYHPVNGVIYFERDGRWGIFDLSTYTLTEPIYDEVEPECDGPVRVRQGDKWGYVAVISGRFIDEDSDETGTTTVVTYY